MNIEPLLKSKTSIISRSKLSKDIGKLGFFSLAFGSMIGVGWVTAMGSWLQQAGPFGTIIAFILGGLLMLSIGLCYAEVTSMLPVAGGEVAYAYKSFGTSKAYLVGWFLSFGYLSVSAFEAISVGKILSYLFPVINRWPLYEINGSPVFATHIFLAMFFTIVITYVNYKGTKGASRLQIFLTVLFITAAFAFVITGLVNSNIENLKPVFAKPGTMGILGGIAAVFITVPFWFVGFDTIPQSAEEAKGTVSHRTIGLLIPLSIIAAVLFYITLIYSTAGVGNWQTIINSELPTAEAFRLAFKSDLLVKLILFTALIGLLTSWNGFFLAGSRVLFAMGRGNIVVPKLGKTHPKYNSPYIAILFSGAITCLAAFLGHGAMLAFVNVGSFCIAAAFLGVSLSFLRLKKIAPDSPRPFTAPGKKLVGYVSIIGSIFIIAVMIIPISPVALAWPLEWIILGILTTMGIIFWMLSGKTRNNTTKKERDFLILENY